MIDLNKFIISFCLFYFYLDKASGLLPNQAQVLRRLTMAFRFCCFLMAVTLVVFEVIYTPGVWGKGEVAGFIIMFKLIPIIMFIIEFKVLMRLRKPINEQPINSSFYDTIQSLQRKRLRLLKRIFGCIIFFFLFESLIDFFRIDNPHISEVVKKSHILSLIIYVV